MIDISMALMVSRVYILTLKLTDLYTLSMYNFLCVNHSTVKWFKIGESRREIKQRGDQRDSKYENDSTHHCWL